MLLHTKVNTYYIHSVSNRLSTSTYYQSVQIQQSISIIVGFVCLSLPFNQVVLFRSSVVINYSWRLPCVSMYFVCLGMFHIKSSIFKLTTLLTIYKSLPQIYTVRAYQSKKGPFKKEMFYICSCSFTWHTTSQMSKTETVDRESNEDGCWCCEIRKEWC